MFARLLIEEMTPKNQNRTSFKKGIIAGLPIVFGYFPVAMAFGLMARNSNVSLRDSSLFSLLVFAGASQFLVLDLIKTGCGIGSIILATFLLNLRHLVMSAALSQRLTDISKPWLCVIAFGVTDETFSVSAFASEKPSLPFLLGLHGVAYSAWVAGTITGYLMGTLLPAAVQTSLGIGLYGLFAALLVPEMKKSSSVLFLALIAGLIYLLGSFVQAWPEGWTLTATIIAAAGIGAWVLDDEPRKVAG